MKYASLAALALFAVAGAQPGAAQNLQFSQAPSVIQFVTPSDIAVIFQRVGWSVSEMAPETNSRTLRIQTTEGLIFLVVLRGCETGPTGAAECAQVQPYAAFTGFGVTLSDVNSFNLDRSRIATLMLTPNDDAILGARFFVSGGVARANLDVNLGNYLFDVANFVEGASSGARTNVSFKPTNEAEGFDFPHLSAPLAEGLARRNPIGKAAPSVPRAAIEAIMSGPATP